MSLITRDNTALVAIDLQEKLVPAMSGKEVLEDKVVRLIKGMKALDVPAVVTQQYTKGIGETIPSVAEALGEFDHIEKTSFSCMANDEFVTRIEDLDRDNIVVCGIEAHICVQQTVIELIEAGYSVYVAADCISSRSEDDMFWSVSRMGEAGASITTYESLLYELLGDSKDAAFKAVSAIVK